MIKSKRSELAMLQWMKKFKEATPLTKNALIALIIWAVPVVLMTIYCYARLDFVRSYDSFQPVEHSTSK
ncbi:putative uncharacterized protein [Waddlia chondrophila 2032/99]|uniref:Uncharacterized protein n=2 Tax=Waddlia chondrophila TaxID=71667 RepID=D6YRL5_WADCW|nr:hypothetical protein [Waddlia chondrophila]ADI38710.1 hypothetical protein wcw_1359 [Waddlia chondrophila WSU 86-1044]CCB92275.1 putative uncharacterized protein [Waddlia chondrophila 2032/99]